MAVTAIIFLSGCLATILSYASFRCLLALHGRHIEDSPGTRVASLGDSGLALDRARLVVLDVKPCIAGELVSALYQRKAVGLGNDSHGRQEADGRDGHDVLHLLGQHCAQDGDFYPFMSSKNFGTKEGFTPAISNEVSATKVSNNRHQLLMTLGYKF